MGKVLFVACTNVGMSMIEEIQNNENIKSEVVGIVNLNADEALNKANYYTYHDISVKYDIPIHYCKNINDEETVDWMKEKKPDIIIQTGWSQKFSDEVLNIPKFMCIGEHPAPLPKGRGAACVNWAILTGEVMWGDSFFQMVLEYDKGGLLAQGFFNIEMYDTVKTVYDKVAFASKTIIRENIDKWTNGVFDVIEQDESKVSYYKRRRPSDGVFSFEMPALELHNFIRAQTHPYPGAYFICNGIKIKALASCLTQKTTSEIPGTVISVSENGGMYVACGDGKVIEILRVCEENQPEMWSADWLSIKKVKVL